MVAPISLVLPSVLSISDILQALFNNANQHSVQGPHFMGAGRLLTAVRADNDIVNCVVSHPTQPLLASSGIDNSIKLWGPHYTGVSLLLLPYSRPSSCHIKYFLGVRRIVPLGGQSKIQVCETTWTFSRRFVFVSSRWNVIRWWQCSWKGIFFGCTNVIKRVEVGFHCLSIGWLAWQDIAHGCSGGSLR